MFTQKNKWSIMIMEIPRGGKFRCNHAPYGSKEMQERRRLPDGFLLMLLSHHFVVAFLVLTTFVVEPAVYNFMQTQKERKPCKIKASAANKRSARRRTRSGGPRLCADRSEAEKIELRVQDWTR